MTGPSGPIGTKPSGSSLRTLALAEWSKWGAVYLGRPLPAGALNAQTGFRIHAREERPMAWAPTTAVTSSPATWTATEIVVGGLTPWGREDVAEANDLPKMAARRNAAPGAAKLVIVKTVSWLNAVARKTAARRNP